MSLLLSLTILKLSIKRALIYVLGGVVIGRMLFTPILSSLDRYSELLTSTENSNNIVPVFFIGGLVFLCFIQRLNNKLKGIRFEMLNFCFYGLAVSLFLYWNTWYGKAYFVFSLCGSNCYYIFVLIL